MDLREVIAIAWKRKLAFALVVVASLATAGVIAYTRTKEYEATATLALTPNVQKGQGFVASDDLATLLSTYGAIAKSTSNKRNAETILRRPLNASVSASTSAGTGILQISATSVDPNVAAQDAQALATAFQQTIQNNGLLIVQQVDAPSVPSTPVQPRPPLILAAGLVLGIGVGLALVLILERWFARIERAEDIKEVTPVPVLGGIPRARQLRTGGRHLLVWDDPDLIGVQESFRALRTGLQFAMKSDRDLLQVTSSSPGDGKSTVAANLAVAIASVGIPTLLVDADFWAPRQHEIFDLPNDEGLSDVMALAAMNGHANGGPAGMLPALPTQFKNLSLLPSGPLPPGPTELLHARSSEMIAKLRSDHSFVVIDSPPLLPVSDASLIAPHVDHVLMVVNAGHTKATSLRQAVQRVLMAKGRLLGVVMNQTSDSPASMGYYSYHGPEFAQLASR
jgi:capsular exopolysaccharide synthesis family protein